MNTSVLCDKSCDKACHNYSADKNSANWRTSTRGATDCKTKSQVSRVKLAKVWQRRSHYIDRKFESCEILNDFSPNSKQRFKNIKPIVEKSNLRNIKRNTTKDKRDFEIIPLEFGTFSPEKAKDWIKADESSRELSCLSTSVAPFLNTTFDHNRNRYNTNLRFYLIVNIN